MRPAARYILFFFFYFNGESIFCRMIELLPRMPYTSVVSVSRPTSDYHIVHIDWTDTKVQFVTLKVHLELAGVKGRK